MSAACGLNLIFENLLIRAGHLWREVCNPIKREFFLDGVKEMRGDISMKWTSLKKKLAGTAFIFALLLGSGMLFETTAQAQYRDRDRNWQRDRDDRRDDRSDRQRDWYRRQQIERARQLEREREWARNRGGYVYRSPRSYPYGNYGGYGGSSSSYEVQKGFRDGLDRGQEDARDRRSF